MTKPDKIEIHGLQIITFIGVPQEEREKAQTIKADLELYLTKSTSDIADDLNATVDYVAIVARVREIGLERPRQLIETLANDLATSLLKDWPFSAVKLRLRKFILPGVDWVAVNVYRENTEINAWELPEEPVP